MYDVEPKHFLQRRRQLTEQIGENGVAIIFGNAEQQRSNDTDFPYRPGSDLLYLTGFREPDSVAVLAPGHADGDFIFFVRERNAEKEVWDGRRHGTAGVKSEFGADAAHPISELESKLGDYLAGRETLWFSWGADDKSDRMIFRILEKLRSTRKAAPMVPKRLADLRDIVHEQRLHKRPEELEIMRRAAEITSDAHALAMKACKPGMHEFELQAAIEHHFRMHGAEFPAYSSIVGAAVNATILHYTDNRSVINEGDMILIDAGCEYHFYAADITRTFPANGKFNSAQRAAYQAVLDSQVSAIEDVRVGLPYNELQKRTVERLSQSLIDLGVLSGSAEEIIEKEEYRAFYPHNVGHYLGIDVHDVGSYFGKDKESRKLEPGMVLTIEPGLYFPANDERVPPELRGIGIRIEDDILVTHDGPENLTASCPKTIEDIEAIMAKT